MPVGEQREPFYIAQTSEPEHLANPQSWFSNRAQEAMAEGGMRSRRTHEKGALLIEVWDGHLPPDQGEPRFGFAAT